MFCPKCATQNVDGAHFCRSCGANISLVPQALTGQIAQPPMTEVGRTRHRRELWPADARYRAAMRYVTSAVFLGFLFTGASVLRGQSATQSAVADGQLRTASDADASTTVNTFCAGCHNGVMRSPSNAMLDRFDGTAIGEDADAWSRAYRQVQAGTMPPAGVARPGRAAAGRLLTAIETALGVTTTRPAHATSPEIAARLATVLWNSAPDALIGTGGTG